jgi:uncharacterized protein (DUF433 family)
MLDARFWRDGSSLDSRPEGIAPREYLHHPGRNVMTLARHRELRNRWQLLPLLSCHMTFERITTDSRVCTGKPCIRGLRFPVARLLSLLAAGETREAILCNYPYLEPEDIDEALRYAAFVEPNIG